MLAAQQPWSGVTLTKIAAEAGLSLAQTAAIASTKADILKLFIRQIDQKFLASLAVEPVEGEPHDRMFDAMLRRFELLTPHKEALRSIAAYPADSPLEWLSLAGSAIETQGWTMRAAGIEETGLRGDLHRLGLARIHQDILRVWLDDDDPGLSKTMAALDRKLRDAEQMARRLETPISILSGLAKAARSFRQTAKPQRSTSDATAD